MATARRSAAALTVCAIALGLTSCSSAGPTGLEGLEAGQCFDEAGFDIESGNTNEIIIQYSVVGCEGSHQGEAIAVLPLALTSYDESAILNDLDTRCDDEFADYVGIDPGQSELDVYFDWPTEKQWDEGIDSGVCLVTDMGELLEGSVAGVAR